MSKVTGTERFLLNITRPEVAFGLALLNLGLTVEGFFSENYLHMIPGGFGVLVFTTLGILSSVVSNAYQEKYNTESENNVESNEQQQTKEKTTMLVLSRKTNESIYIGDNICITVVKIGEGKVRLGIEAPRDMLIIRKELVLDSESVKPDEVKNAD